MWARVRHKGFFLSVTVLATLVAVACAGDSPAGEVPAGSETARAAQPDLRDVPLTEADQAQLKAASAYQAEMATDGILTFREHEDSAFRFEACITAGGGSLAYPLRLTAYGFYYLEYVAPPSQPGAKEAADACVREYISASLPIWSKAKAQSVPEATREQARALLWGCLRARGVDLGGQPEGPRAMQLLLASGRTDDLVAVKSCQDEVFSQFGLPNFGG